MLMRDFLAKLDSEGSLKHVSKEVDTNIEMAAVLKALDEVPTVFENVKGYPGFKVVGGLCSRRELIAKGLCLEVSEMLPKIAAAVARPVEPEIVSSAPCQEVVLKGDEVDLNKLPFLFHLEGDGGRYTSASVAVVNDPETGRNVSYHRMMQIGKNRFTARLIPKRQTETTYSKTSGDMEFAVCIGNSMEVLMAASLGPPSGVDEMGIANALGKTDVVKCVTKDLYVPAQCEIVLEGRLLKEQGNEGPFVDLTETRDPVRQQPVFEVDCITMRKDPIYQALLPGKREHKMLMGMPKEPTIYNEVNKVCKCTNVVITPGGASWLHSVVQIDKRNADDGKKAIEAAFKGHNSMKHVVVVDRDVDVFDISKVEWAIATRFQADKDLVVMTNQPASSLDPSANHVPGQKSTSAKAGIDATKKGTQKSFEPVEYRKVDLESYA